MATHLITYDLRAPGRDYDPVYDYIKTLGTWWHNVDSTWIVVTALSDTQIHDAAAVTSVLALEDPSKLSVETSEELATLRALVEGQLGTFGRSLTLGIFTLTVILAASILYGIVMLRLDRKDVADAYFTEMIELSGDGTTRARTWQWFEVGQPVRRTLCDEWRIG